MQHAPETKPTGTTQAYSGARRRSRDLGNALARIFAERPRLHVTGGGSVWSGWFPHQDKVLRVLAGNDPARLDVATVHIIARAHAERELSESEWESVRAPLGVTLHVLRTRVLETIAVYFNPDASTWLGRNAEASMLARGVRNQADRWPVGPAAGPDYHTAVGLAAVLEARRVDAIDLLQAGGFIARAVADAGPDGAEAALVASASELRMTLSRACLALALAEAGDRAPQCVIGRRAASDGKAGAE